MNISIYADVAKVTPAGRNTLQVNLNNVDLADLVAEIGTSQLLDTLEVSDINDYLVKRLKEEEY